ncbi:hypothetical protein C5167_032748 [Papaver somniferum]|uniref:Transmembrane protein n=1 Tax=Papaver somniferum TaxID=3469 RepID=A0A4Y7K9W7_PAPSO|nr:hypothetical protein C5167_032748 [Papaver somniferum]
MEDKQGRFIAVMRKKWFAAIVDGVVWFLAKAMKERAGKSVVGGRCCGTGVGPVVIVVVVDTCYNGVDGGSFPVVVRLVGAGGIIFMEVGGYWIGVGMVILLGWW